MAQGNKPVMPQRETEERKQEDFFHLENLADNLECRSRNLELSLIRKGVFKKQEAESDSKGSQNGVARAINLSSEFLASVIVGVVLGLMFDKLVGSLPWGLVFFLFLGFAAGVLNILRFVGYMTPSQLEHGILCQNKKISKSDIRG
ncbi:hypothetical protein H704_00343 [Bartonella bacilliformis Peru38]|uniref:ATP synthase protein I n=2 Tax=Bartonella bacilliformis TaxID=774 RepID=A1URU1_BARBK|nr:AtpZ/AtpI family protein [Bartonella bacilliformis]ABM45095.1 conserved hypothetical protein [Bartonella bacilliformis KC583]AMG85539.1 ATP synthase subunit [Bartonella bacilliformis]EKS44947.1 ATP synthase I [Bartonella bacilliformis INS]EYS90171.1 hypothetical protein X472_00627 [Bartonella bacilliformis San Pedro600-02]EYS94925.1 hypothetical protein X470_00435 [Bartonella bacilliformis Peru-18]